MRRHKQATFLTLAVAGFLLPVVCPVSADIAANKESATQPSLPEGLNPWSWVRTLAQSALPERKGLWQQIVSQPYLTPLGKAQKQLFHGQYRAAETGFKNLLRQNELTADERISTQEGLLEALTLEHGGWQFEAVEAQLKNTPDSDQKVLIQARWLAATGRRTVAAELLAKQLANISPLAPETSPVVLSLTNLQAQLKEQQGHYPAAAAMYDKVAALATSTLPDDPVTHTEVAVAIERAAALKGESRRVHQDVLTRLAKSLEIDQTYWPAHLAMARILLSHHNLKEGGAELESVADLNPNCTPARELEIRTTINNYAFEAAEATLKEQIQNQSETPVLAALRGRLLLKQRLPQQALPVLQDALERNPEMNEAQGWLAAANVLRNDEPAATRILHARNVTPVTLYEAAEVLRDARQFAAAEKLYQQSATMAPWWAEPHAALAELYMEIGQEELAKASYEQSFNIDPYNKRAYNQLQLIDELTQFGKLESPHFIIRFKPEDALLARMASEYLESIYPEVTGFYHIDLKEKTKIEFYPTHEEFGVRTTGMPWIGTVGASTGRVIAMDVPRTGQGRFGLFDWARVLRHEFTHTVTLELTNNRIPHWLTEACAQNEEQAPRDWESCQLLANNLRAGTLFKIQDLNWGFIRPKRSVDRHLAYLQSHWLFDYLMLTYGHEKMLAFLNCFARGMIEKDAVTAAFGISEDTLYDQFMAWARGQVRQWGLSADPLPDRSQAEKRVRDEPQSADAKADLAMILLSSGKGTEAEKLLRDALAIDSAHLRARELLGMILHAQKRYDEARTELEQVLAADSHRPATLRTLAQIAMSRKRYDDAEKYFLQLQHVRPLEQASYESLAGIYLIRKQIPQAIAQLRELQAHEQHDDRIARRLAELLISADAGASQNAADAALMAGKALRINPYNALNHALLGDILLQENKPGEAAKSYKNATELQPKTVEYWLKLSDAYRAAGNSVAAAEAEKKARDLR